MNSKTKVLGAGAAVVVVAVLWGVTHRGTVVAAAPPPSGPSVPLAVAHWGTFPVRVSAQGRVGPPAGSSAKLTFLQAGVVGTIGVRIGERVRAGQPLAELRRGSFAIALDQAAADEAAAQHGYGGGTVPSATMRSAQARLAAAQERLRTLQSGGQAALSSRIAAESAERQASLKVDADRVNLARQEQLFQAGISAERDVQAARTLLGADQADQRAAVARVAASGADYHAALAQARADVAAASNDVRASSAQRGVLGDQVASARARVAAARFALDNTVLRAPSDGVVMAVLKHPGESVDPTTPAIEVGPSEDAAVTLQIPGDAARGIHVGNPVAIKLMQNDAHGSGTVAAVVPAVDPSTQITTVVVRGVPPNAVPGDAVAATVTVGRESGIIVPQTALVQDPQTGNTVVFVVGSNGAFTMRSVKLGGSDDRDAVLRSGVRPGEHVAARGGYELLTRPG